MADRQMRSVAPWPEELDDLVRRARCWPGWSFELRDEEWDGGAVTGPRLLIHVQNPNAYHTERPRPTTFLFPVPATSFDRASWQRWLWDRVMDTHRHETGEAFCLEYRRPSQDGSEVTVREHPMAPMHGPGRDPNRNVEVGIDPMEIRVRQDGGRYPGWWWDGHLVHNDEEHDRRCASRDMCLPVQLVEDPGSSPG